MVYLIVYRNQGHDGHFTEHANVFEALKAYAHDVAVDGKIPYRAVCRSNMHEILWEMRDNGAMHNDVENVETQCWRD